MQERQLAQHDISNRDELFQYLRQKKYQKELDQLEKQAESLESADPVDLIATELLPPVEEAIPPEIVLIALEIEQDETLPEPVVTGSAKSKSRRASREPKIEKQRVYKVLKLPDLSDSANGIFDLGPLENFSDNLKVFVSILRNVRNRDDSFRIEFLEMVEAIKKMVGMVEKPAQTVFSKQEKYQSQYDWLQNIIDNVETSEEAEFVFKQLKYLELRVSQRAQKLNISFKDI